MNAHKSDLFAYRVQPLERGLKGEARRLEGRDALVQLLNDWQGEHFSCQQITRLDNGRPYLNSRYSLNLSHSGEWLVVMASVTACGIDIERVNRKRDIQSIWSLIRHPDEPMKPPDYARFYQWWTRKEALWKLYDCAWPARMSQLPVVGVNGPTPDIRIDDVVAPEGYKMSLCYRLKSSCFNKESL